MGLHRSYGMRFHVVYLTDTRVSEEPVRHLNLQGRRCGKGKVVPVYNMKAI